MSDGSCTACGTALAETLLVTSDRRYGLGGQYEVVRCQGCGLVRTEPQPDDPQSVYPTDAYYSYQPPQPPGGAVRDTARAFYGVDGGSGSGVRERLGRRVRLARVAGLPPGPPGKVLDVGCGSGEALLLLADSGWEPHGIEMSEEAVEAGRQAGLADLRAGDLLEAGYADEEFDAVRFWHVLEHTRAPREQLEEARRILRPGGHLVVGVPNFASALSRAARDGWFYLDVPRHLWHFDARTLADLAQRAGFGDVRVRHRSTGTALLGTVALRRGRDTVSAGRPARLAAEALSGVLDAAGRGDALELVARR